MVDFSQIYRLLNNNDVSGTTNNDGSVNSNTQNYDDISVFSNDNSSSSSASQLDDEEFLWWEERLEEKREEELDDSSDNIPDGWESITSEKSKALGFLWETGSYTFETSSGVKISTKDIDNIEIYENKETGEVVVINANGATITSNSKDAKISVYNSVIDKIDTSKGNDEVNIYKSEVDKIDTGRGVDTINIEDSTVNKVNTGSGNDTVNVTDSTISNTNTSSNFLWGVFDSAEDTVTINDSSLGKVKTGRGEDNVIANNSTIDVLNTGSGSDSVSINQTDVEKNKGAKKDTVVQDNNYINIDIETIDNIESQGTIQLDESNSISTSEYIHYLLNQEVGFETEEEYQQYVLQTLTSNLNTMKSVFSNQEDSDGWVSNGYNWLKEATGLGISDKDIEDMLAQQEAIVQGLTDAMNGNSDMTFEQAYEYYTGTTYSKEKIDKYMETANIYSAIMVGCQYDEDYIDKFEEATGKSVEDVTKEYALCQLDTFGKSTGLEDLVEKYSQDQESFTDKLSTAISVFGMTCMVVGAVISFVFPPAAPVGAAFMTAGKYISLGGMFVDNALDLVDDSTDNDGLTKEELGNIALETGVEVVSYAAGRGIGKLTNGLNNVVSSKVAEAGAGKVTSYIAGQTAETVVDTALSLGADYAIAQGQSLIVTGEFMDSEDYWSLDRFLGEGKNQLIGILTGLSSAKVDAYQQGVIKTAQGMILSGDTEGAKTYLKKSGIKMNDASFDGFVKNVQAVDTQMKSQAPQVDEAETQKIVETSDTEGKNPFAFEDSDSDSAKPIEADSTKTKVDYSKLTYDEKVKLYTDEGIDDCYIEELATLKGTQSKNAIELAKAGVDGQYIKELATLKGTQSKNAIELAKAGVDGQYIKGLATLKGTLAKNAIELAKAGVDAPDIKGFVTRLKGTQFENLLKLAKAGVNGFFIGSIARSLDGTQVDIAIKFHEAGVDDMYIDDLAKSLKGTQVDNALELAKKSVDSQYIKNLATLEGTQFKNALELVDKNIYGYWVENLAKLDEGQFKKAIELINKGNINIEYIENIAKLNDKQFSRALELADRSVDSAYIEKFSKSEDSQFERVLKLLDEGFETRYIENFSKLEDSQFEEALKLVNELYSNNDQTYLSAFKNLKHTQMQEALDLINKGVNSQLAIVLAPFISDDYSKFSLREKLDALDSLKRIQGTYTLSDNEARILNFDNEIEKIQNSLKHAITTTDTSIADITKMMQGFFANNNADLDNLLSTTDFSQFGKNGIPLEYSRTEFLGDLSSELSKLPAETQTEITRKLGIEVIQDENGNITGYNGIIDLTKLSADGSEGEVLSLANRFIKENSVSTGNAELDATLNSLIQGMPEFINIIGKQQHATHDLSVDSHILTVLQNVMSNPEYENLSNTDKFCIKFAAIMHDIAKAEGVVDEGHADISALYARDILTKFNLPDETKNRIYEIVKNHHWLKEYNTGNITADQTSALFRRTDDLTIARILAEADLKGVSDEFYRTNSSALDSENQNPITDSLGNINSAGQMFLTNSIIDKSKVPTVEYQGETYQVINFSELSADTDLQQYGFEPNTTVDNFRLLIHTVRTREISQNLENMLLLGDSANQGFLCTSFISIKDKNTYWGNKFGVALQAENANIANASDVNQGSGYGKGYELFSSIISGSSKFSTYRAQVPSLIKESLGLTDAEYSELYTTIQKYTHASQLDNTPYITVGNKTFTGSEIKDAILTANDSIFNEVSHNEVNVYTPQVNAVIAKVNTIEEVPQELLDFAQEHNLPIYLLGSD